MTEKVKRNKIAWSDDLSYDSEEEREKERLLNAELAEIEAPEKPSYSDDELNSLVSYIKRMTTLCYLKNDDWNEQCLQIIRDFLLDPKNMLLTIYYHKGKLKSSLEIPTEPVLDLTYFLRKPDSIFTVDKFHNEVTCGTIAGNIEKCLLRTLECVYAPLIFNTKQWPDNIKNNLSSKVHLFLAKLTDFHYTSQGLTVFYIPKEGLDDTFNDICKNNSLIERFEEIVIYWTKQLKTCLEDNKNIPAMKELIQPIDEYEFWAYRNRNLSSVQNQLKNPKVCLIQDVLLNNHSSQILQFQALCEQLDECIYEAKSNINYLQLIIEPCKQMENLKDPKEFSTMFTKIINIFRVIWMESPFYNTTTNLTNLYSYLSNQIILQCSKSIDMISLFAGKTKKAMEEFRECIECCVEYKGES